MKEHDGPARAVVDQPARLGLSSGRLATASSQVRTERARWTSKATLEKTCRVLPCPVVPIQGPDPALLHLHRPILRDLSEAASGLVYSFPRRRQCAANACLRALEHAAPPACQRSVRAVRGHGLPLALERVNQAQPGSRLGRLVVSDLSPRAQVVPARRSWAAALGWGLG